jgi:Xaa-Pro aminopeptidase
MLQKMESAGWDIFLTANVRTVYYFSGCFQPEDAPAVFLLRSDGSSTLLTSVKADACADHVREIETYSLERCITQPYQDAAQLLGPLLTPSRVCAVERNRTAGLFEELLQPSTIIDATATVLHLRKCKLEDEIDEIRESLRCCRAAYLAARAAIAPGVTELDVHHAMYGAILTEAGTTIPFPGDFACGQRSVRGGGRPTAYRLQPGDLYPLDIFPAPRYYFGDTCRTFCVGTANDAQIRAFDIVRESIRVGEAAIRPGVAAREVYADVRRFLDDRPESERSLWHHVGHGIGHHGHEAPRIIPGSEDIFEVGDVFTLEPGIYRPALGGGIRLEDNYVLREAGVENLFDFEMEL